MCKEDKVSVVCSWRLAWYLKKDDGKQWLNKTRLFKELTKVVGSWK
jgi:hypothetical protein